MSHRTIIAKKIYSGRDSDDRFFPSFVVSERQAAFERELIVAGNIVLAGVAAFFGTGVVS